MAVKSVPPKEYHILILMIVVYVVIFGALSALRHVNFHTQTWDMAVFDDIFRNTIHGHVMASRFEEVPNHFGVHFSPFLFFLVPFYAVIPNAYTLLALQTIALALGAWPLYLIAKKRLANERLALGIAGAYLLSPPLHAVNLFDFHPIAFLAPLLLAALYFLEEKRWRWAVVFLILSASVQEDAILAVASVGVYLLFSPFETPPPPERLMSSARTNPSERCRAGVHSDGFSRAGHPPPSSTSGQALVGEEQKEKYRKILQSKIFLYFKKFPLLVGEGRVRSERRRVGVAITICALIYFFLTVKVIMPSFGGGLLRADRYVNLGRTPAEIATNITRHPSLLFHTIVTKEKLLYLFWLFFPVAFFPLFSRRGLILLVPGLAENLLTSYGNQFNSAYQYDSTIIPALFFCAVLGLEAIMHRFPRKQKRMWQLFGATVFIAFLIRSPVGYARFHWSLYGSDERTDAYRQMLSLAPRGASVSATTTLVPHLLDHKEIFMLGTEKKFADVVLIDAAVDLGFQNDTEFQRYVDRYTGSGAYDARAMDAAGRFIVLKKR